MRKLIQKAALPSSGCTHHSQSALHTDSSDNCCDKTSNVGCPSKSDSAFLRRYPISPTYYPLPITLTVTWTAWTVCCDRLDPITFMPPFSRCSTPHGGDYLPMSGYALGRETPMLFGTASEGSSSERRWPPNSTWPFFFWYSWMRFSTSGPAQTC